VDPRQDLIAHGLRDTRRLSRPRRVGQPRQATVGESGPLHSRAGAPLRLTCRCNTARYSLVALAARVRDFAAERFWPQFHSPKNLSMALAAEAGELLEVFQWLTEEESRALDVGARADAESELADVLIYLVRLADVLGVDLLRAADTKLGRNEERYPADLASERADKYDRLRPKG
jgi:NTP pyrophosphatase (non-canonical NTP hydrolase)